MTSRIPIVAAILAATILSACGGGEDGATQTPGATSYSVTIAEPDEFATGPSRFVFLLENARGEPAINADVHLRFFFIDPVRNDRKTIKVEVDANEVSLDQAYEVTRSDGSTFEIGPGPTGIYVNEIAFDQPGTWVVDMMGRDGNNNLGTIEATFDVKHAPAGPRIGQAAPALKNGPVEAPAIVLFGGAEACRAAFCGPLAEIVETEAAAVGDSLSVIRVETGEDGSLPDSADEWGVGGGPVAYFVDGDGIVRARLHTIATREEVREILQSMLP